MADSLNGKVALVTGASSGIGKATAIAFGAAGARVVVAARRHPEGEATVRTIQDAGGEAIFIQTDVTRPDQVEAMVEDEAIAIAQELGTQPLLERVLAQRVILKA